MAVLSNDPSQPASNKYTSPEGLPYTSDLAGNASCLYVYVESPSAPFTFTNTKGSGVPKTYGSIQEVLAFMAKTPGTLVIYQDGTADWNF